LSPSLRPRSYSHKTIIDGEVAAHSCVPACIDPSPTPHYGNEMFDTSLVQLRHEMEGSTTRVEELRENLKELLLYQFSLL